MTQGASTTSQDGRAGSSATEAVQLSLAPSDAHPHDRAPRTPRAPRRPRASARPPATGRTPRRTATGQPCLPSRFLAYPASCFQGFQASDFRLEGPC